MCRLRFKVTLTSTHSAILQPMPRLPHRGSKCSQRSATASPRRAARGQLLPGQRRKGCTLHGHLGGSLEDCQEAWGMGTWQAVFSPSLPPPSIYRLMESLMLRRGIWLLFSTQFMICPFPRLSSVPSGQCSGRHRVGEGLEGRLQRGGEEGGTGEDSAPGFWLEWRSQETSLRCPAAAQTEGEKG